LFFRSKNAYQAQRVLRPILLGNDIPFQILCLSTTAQLQNESKRFKGFNRFGSALLLGALTAIFLGATPPVASTLRKTGQPADFR